MKVIELKLISRLVVFSYICIVGLRFGICCSVSSGKLKVECRVSGVLKISSWLERCV